METDFGKLPLAATFGDLEASLPSYWTSRCIVLRTASTQSTMLGCVAPTIDWQDRQEHKCVDSLGLQEGKGGPLKQPGLG